jgi:hypothetical protein
MKLTGQMRRVMRHALGLDRAKKSYRNRYSAANGTTAFGVWTELVMYGLAELVHAEGNLTTFRVSDAGRKAIDQEGE